MSIVLSPEAQTKAERIPDNFNRPLIRMLAAASSPERAPAG